MGRPRVRASWAKGLLKFAASYEPLGGRLADQVAPECMREIESAVRISWLTFETYYELIETIRVDLGNEGLRAFLSAYMLDLRNAPLYMPLLAGIDFFGGGAEAMLRLYARGYALSFSGCGVMVLEPRKQGTGVVVRLSEIPPICRREAYAHAHHGGVEGGFALARTRATVEMNVDAFAEGMVVYDAVALDEDA